MAWTDLDQAQWATKRQLARRELLGEEGMVLGWYGSQLVRFDGYGHMLVVAATEGGKTVALILPSLLEPQRNTSLVVLDPKGSLQEISGPYRQTLSRVICLNPCASTSDQSNPLDMIRLGTDFAQRDAQIVAEYLANPDGKQAKDDTAIHFMEMCIDVCTGLLIYGLLSGRARTLGRLAHWIMQDGWEKAMKQMQAYPHPACQWATTVMGSAVDRELGSLRTTLLRSFRVFIDPLVDRVTSRSDFDIEDLRNGRRPITLYLSIPFDDQARLRALSRLYLRGMMGIATQALTGWRYRLKMIVEEMPSLKYMPMLKDGLNYLREYGVQLVLVTPTMNELEAPEMYGTHHNFYEGTAAQVFFRIADHKLAERVSKQLGTHTVKKVRKTWGRGGTSRTHDEKEEPLLNSTGIMQMDADEDRVLVIARGRKVLLRQARWYNHEPWNERGSRAT